MYNSEIAVKMVNFLVFECDRVWLRACVWWRKRRTVWRGGTQLVDDNYLYLCINVFKYLTQNGKENEFEAKTIYWSWTAFFMRTQSKVRPVSCLVWHIPFCKRATYIYTYIPLERNWTRYPAWNCKLLKLEAN